jgi:PAS domain S-box-containing protein
MKDETQSTTRLLDEVRQLRKRIAQLETVEGQSPNAATAESRLRESENKFRLLFDRAFDAILLADREARIIDANDSACKILGYTKEELVGLSPADLHPADELEVAQEAIGRVLREGGAYVKESAFLCKQGNRIDIEAAGVRIEIAGEGHILASFRDITKRKRTENELRASREQLRNLTGHLQAAMENERAAVARTIHDELGQALTALKMDLSWLQRQLQKDQRVLVDSIDTTLKYIDETINRVQKISAELRPGLLDDLGLVPAIEWQARQFQDRTGIACEVDVDLADVNIDTDLATALFRIFQEALTNVARHARASRVRTHLHHRNGALELEVKDDGRGITPDQLSALQSFGLISMRERAHSWGGSIDILGRPGEGTSVRVSVPTRLAK